MTGAGDHPRDLYVGIDTSAYTASLAILDSAGRLLADARRRVNARPGAVGVRQSEALFQHIRHLPELFEEPAVRAAWQVGTVRRVVSSGRPRPCPGSYMPVFQAAMSAGRQLAAATGATWTESTHQEGHLYAALYDQRMDADQGGATGDTADSAGQGRGPVVPVQLLFFHVSGGTTELVEACRDERAPTTGGGRFHWRVVGGSLDLKAGQFVDRVAHWLGLGFPGGAALERLAQPVAAPTTMPGPGDAGLALRAGQRGPHEPWISFSGPATQIRRWVQAGQYPPRAIAQAAQGCLEDGLGRVLAAAVPAYPGWPVYVAGGVAANRGVRQRLRAVVAAQPRPNALWFARPEHSADNAIGLAYLAWLLGHEQAGGLPQQDLAVTGDPWVRDQARQEGR